MSEKKFDLKSQLARLDEIVELLNGDTLSIEESIKLFQEGKQIIASINTEIEKAEEQIEKVITCD